MKVALIVLLSLLATFALGEISLRAIHGVSHENTDLDSSEIPAPAAAAADQAAVVSGMQYSAVPTTIRYSGKYEGCWADNANGVRDLPFDFSFQSSPNTAESCVAVCGAAGYKYAATQYSWACFCGNSYGSQGKLDESRCNMPCTGDSTEICGAGNANSVYLVEVHKNYVGCYLDQQVRDLSTQVANPANTIQGCNQACLSAGFQYFGVQYGGQCFCGNTFGHYGWLADSKCNMHCDGNSNGHCGGVWANSIYKTSWNRNNAYIGCYGDAAARDMSVQLYNSPSMTIESCAGSCKSAGYLYAGLQYASYCFCSNTFGSYGQLNDNQCSMTCAGDSSATCGAAWANQIYYSGFA